MSAELGKYGRHRSSSEGALDIKVVTPSDSVDLPRGVPRALYVGTKGNGHLSVFTISSGSTPVPIKVAYDGQRFPYVCIVRVLSTGTDCSDMLAEY